MIRRAMPPAGRQLQRGFSLVEIMVAMTIGLILLAGLLQLYMNARQAYRYGEAAGRLQENARFALEALSRDLRQAGGLGCSTHVQSVNSLLNESLPGLVPPDGLRGREAAGTAPGNTYHLPAFDAPLVTVSAAGWTGDAGLPTLQVAAGSDILRLWYAGSDHVSLTAIRSESGRLEIAASASAGFRRGQLLALNDCRHLDLFRACEDQQASGTLVLRDSCMATAHLPDDMRLLAGPGAQLFRMRGLVYYIGKRGNRADSPPSLFRRALDAPAGSSGVEEIAEGVENMQVLYGIAADAAPHKVSRYVTADEVTDWQSVISVHVALLLRSTAMSGPAENARDDIHELAGTLLKAPADGYLRQRVSTTVALRNRLP